ncbi:hypothetical protein PHMEG_0006033 [Phytophthora megakarya]|uniref:Integrase catalytic domain-containing protein n=1 Tax=Phytophthora megakarya TaxID=4795 RepID=A0A225WQ51_9STRA|nr:hypothetical protein PHMEG_0006033 [Phytophthora megakarya]
MRSNVNHDEGRGQVILLPELWAVAFKERHDLVWAGHLRGPHTYERLACVYGWPDLLIRNARPREVVPPLRSLRGGEVCDRRILDDTEPFPKAGGGERYVVEAVEYMTRYVVAVATEQHSAEHIAAFIMKGIVLKFGVFKNC